MKYAPLIGLGLAGWGLVTLDWFKIGIGAVLFFGAFFFDTYKKRSVVKNNKLFTVYRPLTELIRIVRKAIDSRSDFDAQSPKATLAQSLFFLGMLDAASQASNMNDKEFLQLFSAIFQDLNFEDDIKSRVLLFHQSLQTDHNAFAAIMKGGDLYTKFINGNTMAPVTAGMLVEEIVRDPRFPASVKEL